MQRHREVAAAPARSSSATWDEISNLIVRTLERSPTIGSDELEATLDVIAPIGRMLVAGGHLDGNALVLLAPPVDLKINTVSGTDALRLDENLDPVPGGSSCGDDWVIALPAVDPLTSEVERIARSSRRVATTAAVQKETTASTKERTSPIDRESLRRRFEDS